MIQNEGCFKKGHKETKEVKAKRIKSLSESWVNRDAYHGKYGTKIHNCWRSMVTRCRGTAGPDSVKKYKNKGITVCERWLSFKNFYEDMGASFKEGLTIDRIDNSKGYYFENCRWATHLEQANNKTNNLIISYDGQSLTLRQWSELIGVSFYALRNRYYKQYIKGNYGLDKVFRERNTGLIKLLIAELLTTHYLNA